MSMTSAEGEGRSEAERRSWYVRIAADALQFFDLAKPVASFLGHNAAISYRIEIDDEPQYVLKVHLPVGTSEPGPVAELDAVLRCLNRLAGSTSLALPEPIPDRDGRLLVPVRTPDRAEPVWCSLHRWVSGEHVRGDLSLAQLTAIGAMTGTLHRGSADPDSVVEGLLRFTGSWMAWAVEQLEAAVPIGLLDRRDSAVIGAAADHLTRRWSLPDSTEPWGVVHGDLHHENLLFDGDVVRPIDFDGMHLAPYSHDLGCTLYHVHYQGHEAAQAYLDGYRSTTGRDEWTTGELDAALVCAAMNNLAFQVTIPAQHGPLLQKNLNQLAHDFAPALLAGRPIVVY